MKLRSILIQFPPSRIPKTKNVFRIISCIYFRPPYDDDRDVLAQALPSWLNVTLPCHICLWTLFSSHKTTICEINNQISIFATYFSDAPPISANVSSPYSEHRDLPDIWYSAQVKSELVIYRASLNWNYIAVCGNLSPFYTLWKAIPRIYLWTSSAYFLSCGGSTTKLVYYESRIKSSEQLQDSLLLYNWKGVAGWATPIEEAFKMRNPEIVKVLGISRINGFPRRAVL